MRRSAFALALALAACLAIATPTVATGPGGWNHVGTGTGYGGTSLDSSVSALHVGPGPLLYVGGSFTNAGGNVYADRIATWNGSTWGNLGTTGFGNGQVRAIATYAGKVYAAGLFENAGGNPNADNLAVFDGVHWTSFCRGTAGIGQVNALQVVGSTLYVGGSGGNNAGIPEADYLVACDLNTGAPSATVSNDGDFTGGVSALAADSNGVLYAGGGFVNLDGNLDSDHVAAYYSGTWHPVGQGVQGMVRSLATQGTDLYVGTDMENIGGLAKADHVARWNGSSWSAVGSNTAGNNGWFGGAYAFLNSMTTSGSYVFATGSFQNANGDPTADTIAYFDGFNWHHLGSDGAGNGPLNAEGSSVAVFGGQVYVGGNMTSAGGDTLAHGIASHSFRLPDAMIGAATGPIAGNSVYNTTAAGQTATMSIHRGSSQHFRILVQNDGFVAAAFTLKGTGAATGHTLTYVDYYHSQANITTAVRNGTFSTGSLKPGGSFYLWMVDALSSTSASGGNFYLTATSTPGTPKDVVKAVVHAT